MSSISNPLDLDRLCILTAKSIPHMLYAFDFDTIVNKIHI